MGGNSHHALADRVGVKYCLGGSFQLFEDLCGYLLRCEGSLFQDFLRLRILALPDVFRAAIFSLFDFERPDCTIILHIWVVELSADDPFGVVVGLLGVLRHGRLRWLSRQLIMPPIFRIGLELKDRGCCGETLGILNDFLLVRAI